jgi:hypothetical protein
MSTFTARAAEVDANLARGKEICAEVEANLALASAYLNQMTADPWPWQRPGNAWLRGKVREIIRRNKLLQAENQHLISLNTLLLLENILERESS